MFSLRRIQNMGGFFVFFLYFFHGLQMWLENILAGPFEKL